IFLLVKQLRLLQLRLAGIDHDIVFVVDHPLQLSRTHIKHQPDAGRHALIKPDVGYRDRELDMPHSLPAHPRKRYLDAAAVTDHALVFDSLVFAARTFPISGRTKYPFAEQPPFFRLECTVVDRFWILDLALAPGTDGVW